MFTSRLKSHVSCMIRNSSAQKIASLQRVKKCRICGGNDLYGFLSLGKMPIPNGFRNEEELKFQEEHYPLEVVVCEKCWLVQLSYIVSPKLMFKNYLYIPSTSSTMFMHFQAMAKDIISRYSIKNHDLVIDIGSNDGTLLGYFKEEEMRVLGIDPASNLAQVARMKGIDTIDDFFTGKLAKNLVKKYGKARIITATNVTAHIDDLHNLIKGIKELLDDEGLYITEFPYLVDLLEKNEFDTIYHEHLSYFSVHPLVKLFKQHSMHIIDILKSPVHGGSMRVYVAKKQSHYKPTKRVYGYLKEEQLRKLDKKTTYGEFARRVKVIKRDLLSYLNKLKKEKKRIVGYGASAKGNVLLNYCSITNDLLDYVVDSIPYKQGKYTPGTHLPIYPESRLEKDQPDYALLLSWNFADEILQKQMRYREKGGQFIITIPYLHVV